LTRGASTKDALFGGAITLWQPARGYRVNIDALLLAAFAAQGRRARSAIDLGAGVGAIGLSLLHLRAADRVAFVEREPDLASLCEKNLKASGFAGTVHEADLSLGLPKALNQTADLVVVNPPYFEPGGGRQRAEALDRRARAGSLLPFLTAAALALDGARARAAFAYPARALEHLLRAAEKLGLVGKRLRFVHARIDSEARLALVEFRRARPGGLVVEPPLLEWLATGKRSPEVSLLLANQRADRR
jgi:tRNA1Val (adenine37-N6)-methyltransferase